MKLCPHCGTQNPPNAPVCAHCGKALVSFDKTVVGFAVPRAPVPPASAPERPFRGTMIGIGAPTREPPPPAPFPSAPSPPTPGAVPPRGHQTIIGMAPPTPISPNASYPAPPGQPFSGTAKYPTPPPPPVPPSAHGGPKAPSAASAGTMPLVPPSQKTIIGVARPGIAPLNPGQAKASTAAPLPAPLSAPVPSAAPSSRGPASPRGVIQAPRAVVERDLPKDRPASKRGIPLVAAIAMIGAAGLFAAALVVWFFYHGHGPIEAHAGALADGTEKLDLTCSACEDGSVVRLDAASARFSDAHATLPLSRPLKVGDNPMTLALVTPRGKQSFADITVPVAFRVRGDTSGLDSATPELRVLVSAVPGSLVVVDGKPLALNAAGEGIYAIDVSALVTGVDPSVKPLERRVPYTVTPPTGTTQDGVVTLQAGITPLVIDAPGPSVVLEGSNFVLAGRTAKSGALTVADRPITVDAAGRFAQMMNVSAPGETTITLRATSKDSAPRLFPLRVRRVDSLVHEAERLRPLATSNYGTIADQPETKRGWAVALDGSVVDARSENYSTVVVMDVSGGCARAPCLARVTYGAPFTLARGDRFSAFGAVDGVVDGPRTGTKIPQIRADFLLKANK